MATDRPSEDGVDEHDVDGCDGYVVVVSDPQTDDRDSFGPFSLEIALSEAEERRNELLAEGLEDLAVEIIRHHDRRRVDLT